ncbi:MAG: O-antigen ligase family protein, partial [Pseudomonadota bacterium]
GDEVPELRYLFFVGLITFVSALRVKSDDMRPKIFHFQYAKLFLALVIWMWMQYFWALDREEHLEGTIEYTKHFIIFFLIYRIIDTREKIIGFLIAHIIGCFWFGYLALGASGGRLESIGGPVGGSNELGMHVATALITGGIMWLLITGWQRWVIFGAIPFIANTIVLTVSRGAFLGFFSAGLIGGAFIPKSYRGKYFGLSILAMILISMLAHEELVERFVATWEAIAGEEQEIDNSAASRIEIFSAGMRMGLDYPLGAGYRGTRVLSPFYMEKRLLSDSSGGRSAHNTFAAAFAEHGFVGAIIYIWMVLSITRVLFRVNRLGDHAMSKQDRAIAVSLIAAVAGMWVSGNFSNNLFTETQYWLVAVLCSLLACTVESSEIAHQPSGKSMRRHNPIVNGPAS